MVGEKSASNVFKPKVTPCDIQEQVFAVTEQPAKGAYGAARKLRGHNHNWRAGHPNPAAAAAHETRTGNCGSEAAKGQNVMITIAVSVSQQNTAGWHPQRVGQNLQGLPAISDLTPMLICQQTFRSVSAASIRQCNHWVLGTRYLFTDFHAYCCLNFSSEADISPRRHHKSQSSWTAIARRDTCMRTNVSSWEANEFAHASMMQAFIVCRPKMPSPQLCKLDLQADLVFWTEWCTIIVCTCLITLTWDLFWIMEPWIKLQQK